jgi:hypothetical protein
MTYDGDEIEVAPLAVGKVCSSQIGLGFCVTAPLAVEEVLRCPVLVWCSEAVSHFLVSAVSPLYRLFIS